MKQGEPNSISAARTLGCGQTRPVGAGSRKGSIGECATLRGIPQEWRLAPL